MVRVRIKYINGSLFSSTINDWIVPVFNILVGKPVVIRTESQMMMTMRPAKHLHAGPVRFYIVEKHVELNQIDRVIVPAHIEIYILQIFDLTRRHTAEVRICYGYARVVATK